MGAQHVFDIEVGSGRLHLIGRRRGDDGHGVPPGQMGLHQGAGLRVDQPGDLLVIQLFAHLPVGLLRYAPHELGVDRHHCGKAHVAQAEAGHGAHQFHQFPRCQVSPPDLLANEGRGRITCDERAVKVKNGGHAGAAGRGLDILQQLFCRRHGKLPG